MLEIDVGWLILLITVIVIVSVFWYQYKTITGTGLKIWELEGGWEKKKEVYPDYFAWLSSDTKYMAVVHKDGDVTSIKDLETGEYTFSLYDKLKREGRIDWE